jgi:hypothetical protein
MSQLMAVAPKPAREAFLQEKPDSFLPRPLSEEGNNRILWRCRDRYLQAIR